MVGNIYEPMIKRLIHFQFFHYVDIYIKIIESNPLMLKILEILIIYILDKHKYSQIISIIAFVKDCVSEKHIIAILFINKLFFQIFKLYFHVT